MASMYELEKTVEAILKKTNELAQAVGIEPIGEPEEPVTDNNA